MDKVRWAVVGTSNFALDWIARGISLGRNCELAAIVSRDAARGAAAAERAGAPLHYTSLEAIDRDRVDGVFLVLPNPQHAPYAIAAARLGFHVIVEKPMAVTMEECRAMIAAAREAGVTLAVAQCMEWAPPVARARELVEEGVIGTPISASISAAWNVPPGGYWREDDTIEQGGGPVHDAAVHAIDAIQRILGPVERVAALIDRRVHQYAAEDTSTTLLRFASGAHGVMFAHFNCNLNSMEIVGSAGRLWSSPWLGREFSGDLHLEQGGKVTSFELPSVNVYVPQAEHVSEAILTGRPPVISGERGMANMAVLWAAIQSGRSAEFVEVATVQ